MRRVAGLFVVVIFVLLVPTLAKADLFGLGLPWGSSWGQPSSGTGSCCDPGVYYGAWGKCCSAVYLGYEIQQGHGRKPVNLSLEPFGRDSLFGTLAFDQKLNTDFSDPGSLWLGVSNYCQCSDRVGIMVSGWYLFPSTGGAQESYSTGIFTPGGGGSTSVLTGRTWSTSRSWGWVDGALVIGDPCGLNLIAGFRWDSFSIKLTNPGDITFSTTLTFGNNQVVDGTPFDEANLTLNSYIPLIGTQACWGGPCCGLLFRVVGFPWVPGNLRYGESVTILGNRRLQVDGNYDRAYFMEIFSEYSRTCPGFGCIGIFARWNWLDCRSSTRPQVIGPIRTSWTIGGRIALEFNTPF